MKVFKYRLFEKWAKKHSVSDDDLNQAVLEIEKGLCDATLGGNVYKKRCWQNRRRKTWCLQNYFIDETR